jgi:heterodisulfide reductase subunit A
MSAQPERAFVTEERVGVYICHCGVNIAQNVDIEELIQFAKTLPSVVSAKDYKFLCSEPGQNLIASEIKELSLTKVVVSSCSPLMHEATFRKVCKDSGINPYLFFMANIREHCSWVTEDRKLATEKAKALISGAVKRIAQNEPLTPKRVDIDPDVLILGGGIAGISAALKLSEAEKRVYLVEREPSIGGLMAKLDKTFPTLDCAACILTPKMADVAQSENVEVMSLSEVTEVSGYVGNFTAKILKRPRFVDITKCNGCGDCEKSCPVELPSKFDENLKRQKAISRPFPQAIPSSFYIEKRGMPACRSTCPAGVNVPGYIALIKKREYEEAKRLIRERLPFPGICGRICPHPCEAECRREKIDEPIAISYLKRFVADRVEIREEFCEITEEERIAVVGAGPSGLTCAYNLRRKGYRVTVFEKERKAGGMLRIIPDYRLPKDVLERELRPITESDIEFVFGKALNEDFTIDQLFSDGFSAVYIATGAGKPQRLNIPGEESDGVMDCLSFLKGVAEGEITQISGRVIVIGGGNSAIDSARCAIRLGSDDVTILYRRTTDEMPANYEEVVEAKEEGVRIRTLIAPVEIKREGVLKIRCSNMRLEEPDETGRRRPVPIEGSFTEVEADYVIVAIGQRPEIEPIEREGLFFGGDVLSPRRFIDAVAEGNKAAESIICYLKKCKAETDEREIAEPDLSIPIEKRERIRIAFADIEERRRSFIEVRRPISEEEAIGEAERCLSCAGCAECRECERSCEPEAVWHSEIEEEVEVKVGSIILATGTKPFDPAPLVQYGYNRLPNVYTAIQFERICHSAGPTGGKIVLPDGREPKSFAIVHCVGSRDVNFHNYCSRVCCMYSLKFSHLIKERIKDAEVFQFYIDIRCFGKGYEEFYNRVQREGVNFVRGRVAEILEEDGKLNVIVEDTLIGKVRRIPVDMVILSTALESQDAENLSKLFSLSIDSDGFFIEKHPKLAPVATMADGIFIAGACQGPKDIPDAVAQGEAAAASALSMIERGYFEIEPITSTVDDALCGGCRVCEGLCPYNAIEYDSEKNTCSVNDVLCKGCGSCVASCPAGAITANHFTKSQILAEIEGVLEV